MTASSIAAAILGTAVLAALLVLPGFRIAERLAGRARRGYPVVALSCAVSVLLAVAVAVPLLAVGRFSGLALAAILVALAAWSGPATARWVRRTAGLRSRGTGLARGGTAVWVAALAGAWAVAAVQPGFPPADRLQWYYAEVAGQLSEAGGIPTAVAEWGREVRWLPDYLVFDVLTEAYRALLPGIPLADAISAWRIPVAAMGIAAVFAVLRLYVGRPAAIGGAALIAGGTFFLAKFNAYKPEALGIVLGLVGVWLVVAGLRSGRRSWLLVAGALFGVLLSVHAIAAVALGLLAAGLGGAEWLLATRRRVRLHLADGLARAVVLGLVLSVALGVGLQGRAAVASQALAPGIVRGEDPTWTFFLYSTGVFSDPLPVPPSRPLAGGVSFPWDGFRVTSAFGWWLLAAIGVGLALLVAFGGRRGRTAVLGTGLAGGLLVATIAFFGLAFDTYVPRWTGLVRFGQYVPFGVGLGVALALEGYGRAFARLAARPLPRAVPALVAIVGVAWLAAWTVPRYLAEPRIEPPGQSALAILADRSAPGDVVVSNVLTAGTIEAFTGRENPLESRQPLIEEPDVLRGANDLLRAGHEFFAGPVDRRYLDALGARWVLVADEPATLGATATLGGSVAATRQAAAALDLREVWTDAGVALFEVGDPAIAAARVDRLDPLPRATPTVVAGLAFALVALLVVRLPSIGGRRARAPSAVEALGRLG